MRWNIIKWCGHLAFPFNVRKGKIWNMHLCVLMCKEKKNRAHAKWTDSLPFSVCLWMLRTACVLNKPLKIKIQFVKLEVVRRMFGMRFQMFFFKWKQYSIRSMPSRCASENNIVSASFWNDCELCERYVDPLKIYVQTKCAQSRQLRSMTEWQIVHYFFSAFLLVLVIRNQNTNAECVEII